MATKQKASQVKKIGVSQVWGRIDLKQVLNSETPITVMKVGGVAVATKDVPTQFGFSTQLQGQFTATNPETGETYRSGVLYLPDVALIPIRAAMAMDGVKGVKFAINLQVQAATNKRAGGSPYEYTFEDLMPPTEDDPLSHVEALLLGNDVTDDAKQIAHVPEEPAAAKKGSKARA